MSNFKKWIVDNFLLTFLGFLLLTAIIVGVAIFLSYCALFPFIYYSTQNFTLVNITSFVNQNSSDFVNIFVNTMLTLGLIIFSALSLSSAEDALKQSQKQQKQFQDEQRIKDIENRLEKFYIPAEEIINHPISKKSRSDTVYGHQPGLKDSGYVIGLKHLRKYSYLANKKTLEVYEKYIATTCESRKTITCRDMYRDFKDYNCTDKIGNCVEKNWAKCENNLDRCKYFSKCPTKDQSNIIINNTECKHFIDLKDKITKDIEEYKYELLRLKEQ